ncbi:MAG TPA: fuconate dehydratase, partial [Gammaproteobacteria bacterium]|nr:fuconate dehydratase [Gammaproteobacteria bacterium]
MNADPDYSASYITLETENGACGYGLVFTIGRGNDLCCRAVEAMADRVLGYDFTEIQSDILGFYRHLQADSQLRWLGPEKGLMHMAAGGIMNAAWDLWARLERKPLWRMLSDMTPEQFVACVDFRYLENVISRSEALALVQANEATKAERIATLESEGYPAYTTSAGWLGYSDEQIESLVQNAIDQGFRHVKLKVGQSL